MKLVVVESPAKARTIERLLGRGFRVQATLGHIKDLPKSKLSVKLPEEVDESEAFEPHYTVIRGKADVIKKLKDTARKAEIIYLATDPDREGEAIAWHIAEELAPLGKDILRSEFIEITERGVKSGIENPRRLNSCLYDAQKARRVLDRLVGYLVSPLLWEKVRRGLSAGRVQTVALRLLVERELSIRGFKPEKYFVITGKFLKKRSAFTARLVKFEGKDAVRLKKEEKDKVEKALKGVKKGVVRDVEKKKVTVKPPAPFTTSKLQQEASVQFGFTPEKTMRIAQRLYEGVELEIDGKKVVKGLITYMRTDSTRISPDAVKQVRDYIADKYGREHLPKKPNVFKSSKFAQEAHEAIRPTDLKLEPSLLRGRLSPDEYKLYELIYRRLVASQMKPAEYHQITVHVEAASAIFRVVSKTLTYPGFGTVYPQGLARDEDGTLPELQKDEVVTLKEITVEEKETQPPPRYTDATLVKVLEEKGIGRPSTYAQIIKTLEQRGYVMRDRRTLVPTELGILVSGMLTENFKNVFDVGFTARMEENLDLVEKGEEPWKKVVMYFYNMLKEELEKAKTKMKNVKASGVPTELKCEKCGATLNIMSGRFGEYLQCTDENCGAKKEFVRDKKGMIRIIEENEIKCDLCGKPMVLRSSRKGKYYACTGFPDCTNIKVVTRTGEIVATIEKPLSEKCPECGAVLHVRRSRKGVRYISCSNSKCTYTRGYSEGQKCPRCGGALVERRSARGYTFWGCENYPECKYVESKNSRKSSR